MELTDLATKESLAQTQSNYEALSYSKIAISSYCPCPKQNV